MTRKQLYEEVSPERMAEIHREIRAAIDGPATPTDSRIQQKLTEPPIQEPAKIRVMSVKAYTDYCEKCKNLLKVTIKKVWAQVECSIQKCDKVPE